MMPTLRSRRPAPFVWLACLGLPVLLLGPSLARASDDEAVQKREIEQLQGVWTLESMEIDGRKADVDSTRGWFLVIRGDQYNPGSAYWDIAAIDYYGGSNPSSVYGDMSYYNAMLPLTNEMPMAVGETFFFPTPEVQQNYPQMSFFMIWAYGLHQDESGNPTNSDADIQAAYNDPRVITLADMPGWQ